MSSDLRTTGKSFWQRPEGKLGLVASGIVLLTFGYAMFRALPALITLAENMLQLAALCSLLALVFYFLADSKLRAFAAYLYKAFFRIVTGFFIELDPIGILRQHIAELGAKLELMRTQLGNLNGQIRRVERLICENAQLRDNALSLAHTARSDLASADACRLQARHAVRLEDSNARLGAMQTQMQTLFRMLKKLGDTCELVLQDMQNTVDIKTRERSSMKAAYSAYRGALAILQGQSEGRDSYDRAMEFLNDDYARKLGEIEMFMDFSDGLIKAADLENLAYDARGTERLDEWERRLSDSLLGPSSSPLLAAATRTARAYGTRVSVEQQPVAVGDPLDALLDGAPKNSPRARER
jgi:hypothetical protein